MVFRFFFIFLFLLFSSGNNYSSEVQLPALGDASSSVISLQQEHIAGQQWLRAFRRQAPVQYDPLIYVYLEDLIQGLTLYSQLQERHFSLLIVDSPSFNAFAVPGNVIGINTGLFSYAETEDQLSSVITHELAHLSQRHFARRQENQRRQSLATMAALLGSILIMATVGGDEGLAALTVTQAAAIDNQLRYSRTHEQEADRIGMQNLARAGMNPEAAANMFQHLLISTRYNDNIRQFDFMLTHPLTDSRVSDAFNQARTYERRTDRDSFEFHLIKNRIQYLSMSNKEQAVTYFSDKKRREKFPTAQQYGLALAYLGNKQLKEAEGIIDQLYKDHPSLIAFVLLKIDLLQAQNKADQAFSLAETNLSLSPNSYPITMKIAEMSLNFQKPNRGVVVLDKLINSRRHPDTPDIWYLISELKGLTGDIKGVHLSRAQYFEKTGAYTQAQRHLNLAIPFMAGDPQAIAKAKIEINRLEKFKQNQPF